MEPTKPSQELPPWAKQVLNILIAVFLSFIAAKYGIAPAPMVQSQPSVLVIHSGQPTYSGSNGCQCLSVEKK